ncbi:hypothetical protein B9Z19DRAFT_465931 [Tuber borchii]|uniref:Uncharacterized protein n=1 Tax=Tuber borchii TaxID=42251 RepID=A0A2T7A3K6_TUBBO|nr:hypothetical protein B9Z19DRAFT_465931 [Tuber borchii]
MNRGSNFLLPYFDGFPFCPPIPLAVTRPVSSLVGLRLWRQNTAPRRAQSRGRCVCETLLLLGGPLGLRFLHMGGYSSTFFLLSPLLAGCFALMGLLTGMVLECLCPIMPRHRSSPSGPSIAVWYRLVPYHIIRSWVMDDNIILAFIVNQRGDKPPLLN